MSEVYVVVPMHMSACNDKFDTREVAAIKAAALCEKDRVPRVVMRLITEVRASQVPRVDIVHLDGEETSHGR